MIIDFSNIKEQVLPHFKGGEKEYIAKMQSDDSVKIMKGRLSPSASIGMHTHTDDTEIIFLTKGNATVVYDGQVLQLTEGECHYCPKGHTHSLVNNSNSDIEFYAVVAKQ